MDLKQLAITKHHGLGNDFLVLFHARPATLDDAASLAESDESDELDELDELAELAELARRLCDRRRGLGADGLLVASEPVVHEGRHTATMVLFNADASRAEMSGNGIRCFAQAVQRRLRERDGTDVRELTVATDAGLRTVTISATDDPATVVASVDMGPVDAIAAPANWDAMQCHPDRPVAHLSLGNPHSVVGVDDVADVDLAALGALVPHVNLEIVAPTERPDEIRMRVHERGAGITEACGTGACAAAHAAVAWGLATPRDAKLVVHMDGGTATVTLDTPSPGRVTLTGPATYVASITIDIDAPTVSV